MRITKKMIKACADAGACAPGLRWISNKPRNIEQLYTFNPDWFFWLECILSKPANDAYNAAVKPARDAYKAAVKPASDAYDAAVKPANDAYTAAVKPASDAYNAAMKSARDAYT